jgi:TrmH RNA methyltransferase
MDPDTICGARAVSALFARRTEDVLRLFYLEGMRPVVGPYCATLARTRKPYRMVDDAELAKIAGTSRHGGIAAVAKPRAIPFLDADAPPAGRVLLVLDGIGNPHNLGAIARSAAFFGVTSMLLTDAPGHAKPSDAAYRTAEGGLEWLDLYRTRDLPRALAVLAPHFRVVAASLTPHAQPLHLLPRERPIALVLGNEERGVSEAVLAGCRRHVRIPGAGRVQSLNVAQAAAVLLHDLNFPHLREDSPPAGVPDESAP